MSAETQEWLDENILVGMTAVRGNAWHRLNGGTNTFEGPIPIERVRELLARYEAEDVALKLADDDSLAEGYKAIVRKDTRQIYKIFSEGYQQHDYREWLVNNVGTLLDSTTSDLVIANAGGLKGGAVAFVQIETPQTFHAVMGVEFRPNITAVTSLNGRFATAYKFMSTNVVCDNTLSLGISERAAQYKFKHTSGSLHNIRKVRSEMALGFINDAADAFAAEVAALSTVKVSDKDWAKFLDAHVEITPESKGRGRTLAEHKRDDLTQLWNTDPMVAPWKGTAYGVIQAVNTWDQWQSIVKGQGREERSFYNALSGATAKQDREVEELILSIAAR